MPILATLAPGTYQLRLLRDDGYEKLATSNNFTVTGQSTPTVAASPSTLTTGSPVTATWSGIASPAARDWIGIYTTAAGDQSFIDWRYVSCLQTPGSAAAAGACAFPTTGLGTGNYQFRLFRDDGFTKLATSNTFTVTSGLQAAGSVLRHFHLDQPSASGEGEASICAAGSGRSYSPTHPPSQAGSCCHHLASTRSDREIQIPPTRARR